MNFQELERAAISARGRAYCIYSQFAVGAALLTEDGQIITGANIENASYGLTVCAERVAIQTAVAAGHRKFQAMVVATSIGASPCGACRQVLYEFPPSFPIRLINDQGEGSDTSVKDLLPAGFEGSFRDSVPPKK